MLSADGTAGIKRTRYNPGEESDEHARVAGLQNSLLELHHCVFGEFDQSTGSFTGRADIEQRYAEKLPEFAEGAKESHAVVLKTDEATRTKFGAAMAYLHEFRAFLVNSASAFFDSLQRNEARESARALRVARALQEDVERCFEEAIESMAIELLNDLDSEAEDVDSDAGESVSERQARMHRRRRTKRVPKTTTRAAVRPSRRVRTRTSSRAAATRTRARAATRRTRKATRSRRVRYRTLGTRAQSRKPKHHGARGVLLLCCLPRPRRQRGFLLCARPLEQPRRRAEGPLADVPKRGLSRYYSRVKSRPVQLFYTNTPSWREKAASPFKDCLDPAQRACSSARCDLDWPLPFTSEPLP